MSDYTLQQRIHALISPAMALEVEERRRQNEKWGEQNHPDGTGPDLILPDLPVLVGHARADHLRYWATERCEARFAAGDGTWADVLLEEVFEALAESNPRHLHTELVQIAAVATQWADAIQRRGDLS